MTPTTATNQDGQPEPVPRLDGTGESCATFTPIVAARMRQLEPGQRLEVTSDDPSAPDAIASWARLTGNPLLATIDEGGNWRFVLQRKQPSEKRSC